MPAEFSRRRFIASAALAAGAAASWTPLSGLARIRGSADRIRIGVIGTGGQGTWHVSDLLSMSEQENIAVTRVCDVYRRRLNNAARMVSEKGAPAAKAATMDYREILDDKEVDAVLIATPDHWHTKMAIEAMEAGKDVFVEKPLSLTVEQAIACRDAVRRTNRVLAVGPQGTSERRWWDAGEAVKAGRIGKPVWSQGAYCRNSQGGQFNWHIDTDAGPNQDKNSDGYVDWDMWLGWKHGLAQQIAWNADHFFRFRKYFAYNGGVATDLMYHKLAPLLIALAGPDGEYPKRVVSSGGRFLEKDERDIPDTHLMMIDYPSEHTVVLASVMTNDVGLPDIIRGQRGTMSWENNAWKIAEQGAWWKEFRKANADLSPKEGGSGGKPWGLSKDEKGNDKPDPGVGRATVTLPASGGGRSHNQNWIDCIRSRAKPNCNIELGCATMVAIKLGVEAYRQNKVMMWDSKAEKVVVG